MFMYNLIKHSDKYSKSFENLWKYYTDQPDYGIKSSDLYKLKVKGTENSLLMVT